MDGEVLGRTCRSRSRWVCCTVRRSSSFKCGVIGIFIWFFSCCPLSWGHVWYRWRIFSSLRSCPAAWVCGSEGIMILIILSMCEGSFDRLVWSRKGTFLPSWRFESRCNIGGRKLTRVGGRATYIYYNRTAFKYTLWMIRMNFEGKIYLYRNNYWLTSLHDLALGLLLFGQRRKGSHVGVALTVDFALTSDHLGWMYLDRFLCKLTFAGCDVRFFLGWKLTDFALRVGWFLYLIGWFLNG